jgi:WD40 repeat protein
VSPRPFRLAALACLTVLPAGAYPAGPPANPARTDLHGDPLPPGARARLGVDRWGHEHVSTLAYSPDGKYLATAGFESVVRLWDTASGRQVAHARLSGGGVSSVAFAPGGKSLAATGGVSEVLLLRVPSLRRLRRCAGHKGWVNAVAFSPDGRSLASAGRDDRTVRLWDPSAGEERWRARPPKGVPSCLAFSPGRKTLAVGCDNLRGVWLLDLSGKDLGRVAVEEGYVSGLAFSPDGRLLASGQSVTEVRLWDVSSWKKVRVLTPGADRFAFSPDGKYLAGGDTRGAVCWWEVRTGRRVARHEGSDFTGEVPIAFSPDGKRLAAVFQEGPVRFWEASTGKSVRPLPRHEGAVLGLAFAPDGRTLVTGSSDRTLALWDPRTGAFLRTLGRHRGEVTSLALAPDGRTLVSAGRDNAVSVWDVPAAKQHTRFAVEGAHKVALSPDGRTVYAGGYSDPLRRGTLSARDLRTGRKLWQIEELNNVITRVTCSPGGEVVAAASPFGGGAVLVDASSGKLLDRLAVPGGATDLAFLPGGRSLLATGLNSPRVHVYEGGREVRSFGNSDGHVVNLALSPDGRLVATQGLDDRVQVWEIASGQQRLQLPRGGSLAFSPDGRALAAGGSDTTVLIWDLTGQHGGARPARRERLWEELAGPADRAGRALWALAGDPARAVPLLRRRLREEASAEARRIDRLVEELDSDDFGTRERATRELGALGRGARPALEGVLAGRDSPEARRRARRLLARLEGRGPGPRELRSMRAVEALEHAGTREARDLLRELARGARGGRVAQEARAALRRLDRRAAP